MQLKEGRCPNCGSILQLNAEAPKGHCLFCDAVFDNEKAFLIAENPSEHTFPNEEQPKYEGPSLDPVIGYSAGSAQIQSVQGRKATRAAAREAAAQAPAYVPSEPVKAEPVRIPPQLLRRLLIFGVAFLVIVAAITIPMIWMRERARNELKAALPTMINKTVDVNQAVQICHLNNDTLLIAYEDAITEEEALDLFRKYGQKRAELQKGDPQNFARTYGGLTVRIVTPDGGYEISRPKDEAALTLGDALKKLS